MSREYERKSIAMEAVLEASSGLRETRISDLSLGGCYVESMTEFCPGEPVAFDLVDGVGSTVGFTGEVAYVLEGFGFGLRFTNLSPDQLQFLQNAIAEQ